MTVEQVEKFIYQVKQKDIHLDRIQILGGEPFLHPRLNDFISNFFYKLMVPGNLLHIEIWTNGIIDSNISLKDCRSDPNIDKAFNEEKIVVVTSSKEKEKKFMYVLSAPVDLGLKWSACSWPRKCGILLNTYGYWPGGACGPIALLFGLTEYAKYEFPIKFRDTWPKIEEDICRYCVVGCEKLNIKKENYATPSYRNAISKWMKGAFLIPKKY
jgi:hypothetical protein